MKEQKSENPRLNYEVRIPPNATPEEIAEFMKKFNAAWFAKDSNELVSKQDEASS
jgi:hypothetical protein